MGRFVPSPAVPAFAFKLHLLSGPHYSLGLIPVLPLGQSLIRTLQNTDLDPNTPTAPVPGVQRSSTFSVSWSIGLQATLPQGTSHSFLPGATCIRKQSTVIARTPSLPCCLAFSVLQLLQSSCMMRCFGNTDYR